MNSTSLTGTPLNTRTNRSDMLPQVVIDLEKLRHINCGLGRFSLYLAQELLARSDNCFEPVFFYLKAVITILLTLQMPSTAAYKFLHGIKRFFSGGYGPLAVTLIKAVGLRSGM